MAITEKVLPGGYVELPVEQYHDGDFDAERGVVSLLDWELWNEYQMVLPAAITEIVVCAAVISEDGSLAPLSFRIEYVQGAQRGSAVVPTGFMLVQGPVR